MNEDRPPRPKLAYTVAEVAEQMQVSIQTVRRQAQAGLIPHVRIGAAYRFPVAAFDRWLDEQAQASLAPDEEQMLQRLLRGT
jgi:excisionase family DNA binding protein